ncbi:thiamine phosphate synthase [Lutimaribacter sp. EGI FJ00015]|uniref:Thiamine phosphate synthase n=1 Tax=Lutimaribacter degradans TaxID=2945989 RepID=A0ACC5ZVZ2_9RHOB|nr:thiamine phosphate synthase [Lutimaribacter sp. EGI FJ00013]MCM2562242.1 thiamine phosphate synthase [Lutimaribacter sp. EGI FJ00013]MCO0613397.1 thiamine phosphate synthase [Lutimaribacter sp. EGI FJ00015]MCO0636371.1 thiamine phosphate synthase [Lutimaribacter sp. EGI FJ00014]
MSTPEQPQIYLVTPPEFELARFPAQLGEILDIHDVACVRLSLATRDEDRISRAADALREVTHARDVALVIDSHILMVERLGLDGVHLPDGARNLRKARKELGQDAIVGAFCGASRHDGMNAGDAGADYIAFGPLSGGILGDGTLAERELFEWWSMMIELPVVAEGGLTPQVVRDLSPVTDFFAIGPEIWSATDPASELAALKAAMGQAG